MENETKTMSTFYSTFETGAKGMGIFLESCRKIRKLFMQNIQISKILKIPRRKSIATEIHG